MCDRSIFLIPIAWTVGAVGDLGLQLLVSRGWGGDSGWGLKAYFSQHGRAESISIAAGIMTGFYMLYIFGGIPLRWYWLALFGVLLDLLFRSTMIFPSLRGYYQQLNYFWSALWGIIPMILPFLLWKIYND